MSAPQSSKFFRATLDIDEQLASRLEGWADENCARHRLSRDTDGSYVLYAERFEPKTNKAARVCLRTVFSNWKTPLSVRPDWLTLLSESHFEEGIGCGTTPSPPEAVPVQPVPPEPWQEGVTVLLSLSPGFDERGAAMLRELRVGCVA